jgi:nitroimidazol reductase NimA-like FMN-containing flavoprotein (pyridoxamine 5'-phosphate oxidase superfamily)
VTAARKKLLATPKSERPHMPGYGVPASREGLLPWTWAEQRLRRSHNYWFCTTGPQGEPHVMPIWGVWVDGIFCFSTGRQSRKARNLAANPKCVICNEKSNEAVIVHGTAAELTDADRIKELGRSYVRKYKPWTLDPKLGPIFIVRPTVVFAMYEKKFANAATKWRF